MKATNSTITALGAVIAAAFCFAGATRGAERGLFVDAPTPKSAAAHQPTVARHRPVILDVGALRTQGVAAKLRLNLFNDADFEGVIEQILNRGADDYSLLGTLTGVPHSTFALVVKDGVAVMNVRTTSRLYQLRYAGNNLHEVREIDESKYPPCGNTDKQAVWLPPGAPAAAVPKAVPDGSASADSSGTIDVMVVYTVQARDAAGGTAAMQALINLAIAESNTAYQQSLITPRLRLVHQRQVSYTQSATFETDLDRLTKTADGYLDEVHSLRNTYGADLVVMLVDNNQYCGLAYPMGALSAAFEDHAFSVVNWDCATGYYSLSHELGHNMGCRHDRANGGGDPGLYPYSYGWRFTGTDARQYRTIMAYAPGTRIQRFSNPSVLYQGTATGVAVGQPNAAHNAQTINNSAATVANFRQTVVANISLPVALDTPGLNWTTGGWQGENTDTHDGVDAAQSGTISDNGESWVETTVREPGTLTFWWKVSSEANFDYLGFYLNGVLQSGAISGEEDWQERTFNIGGGTSTLRWRYSKDSVDTAGSDLGWLDQVVFTPARPVITQQPTNVTVSLGATANFSVMATGVAPFNYQWSLNGAPIPGAANNLFTLPNVDLTNQGLYQVRVSNFAGAAFSYSVTLTVLQPSNTVMRVAAANLTSGNNRYYESPGLNILKGLRPDIVALQEWNYGTPATGTNTTAAFRAMVDYAFGTNFVYYREPLPGANNIPNGIISRYPILASGWWDDGDANITDRNFVWARLDVPGSNDLYVVSVHLKASNTASDVNRRAVQATNLVNLIATNFPTNAWVVVAGDCNIFDPSEPAYQLLSSRFWDNPTPTDAESGGYPDTNQSRQERYDYVFLSRNLTNQLTPLVMPSHTFSNGLVFDSRVYAPLSDVPPALSTDSGASGMQHMAVLRAINATTGSITNRFPGILTQPQGGDFACGTSLTLSVATYGLGPISYQWRHDGNSFFGAISRTYSFTTASASSGEYSVVITSAGGSVTSSVAVVSVYDVTPPVIQPHRDLILVARPGECGALADYRPTATDDCGGTPLLTCEPPAGTMLPVGRTTVNCTAVDSSGNSNSSSFVVTVYPWGGDDIAGDQWTPHEANRDWRAVASSTNGSRLVAVASSDRIYTSADFGETWTARENSRGWSAVVSSADGRRLLAADDTSHFLYASSDFGTNWVARIAGEPWTALSSSADGSRLLASYYNANAESGGTFVSSDGGTNWDNLSNLAFFSLAASAEGRLVAATGGAYISDIAFYRSSNYGSNWTKGLVKQWGSVASTTNGLRLLAAAWDDLYLSVNGGANWQACGLGGGYWRRVASSADGRRLFATRDQAIYRSSDFGTNWIAVTNDWFCEALAVSADGNRLVAVEYGGRIHTSIGALPLLTLPTILGATNRTVSATGVEGAIVHFPILATNVCQPSVPVVCTPPSGSLFPPGTNVVFCQAVDGLGQTNVSNFELVVVPLPPLAIAPGGLGFVAGQFGFAITGRNGQIVIIEASSNLQAWTPIWTNTLGSGALPFNDPMSASNGSRFYRVREP